MRIGILCYARDRKQDVCSVKYNYQKADFSGLRGELGKTDWKLELAVNSTEEITSKFMYLLTTAMDKHIPKNENRPKKGKTNLSKLKKHS